MPLYQNACLCLLLLLATAPRCTEALISTKTATTIQHSGRSLSQSVALGLSDSESSSNSENTNDFGITRRQAGELTVAGLGLGGTYIGTRQTDPTDYGLWGILPVGPYKRKKTIRETIAMDKLWTCDQKFGILNVQVPLRMTILRLKDNSLLIYNPIAATDECVDLIRELEQTYSAPVKHIIVGSVALEHKAYGSVLAQKFPRAQIWLTPGQYAFPVNLPNPFLGYPTSRTSMVPRDPADYPQAWKDEHLQLEILGPILSRDGAFAETVLLHPATKTLLVTDTCLQAVNQVPAIYESDPAPLLYHARDTVTEILEDTPEIRLRGWRRIVLFGLFFTPSGIAIKDLPTALDERRPDINGDFAGIYPWDWNDPQQEAASWQALQGSDAAIGKPKPLVAPILQTLLLNRSPVEVLDFAAKVGSWDFTRVIPAHLQNDLRVTGREYQNSFAFLTEPGVPAGYPNPLKADLQLLLDANDSLLAQGAIAPAPPKVGGSVSRADILSATSYRCRANVCAPQAEP